jgi:hypothetical protein
MGIMSFTGRLRSWDGTEDIPHGYHGVIETRNHGVRRTLTEDMLRGIPTATTPNLRERLPGHAKPATA